MPKLSDRTRTILRRAVGYPLYFLVCTLVFGYCTFPYDRVRDRIEDEVERALPGADLEIVSIEPSWLTGVVAQGIRLTLPPAEGEERATPLTLAEARVRVGLLDYLLGTTSASFYVEMGGGGTIEGVVADDGTSTHVEAHVAEVGLGRIGPLRRFTQLPVQGTVTGDIDVTVAEEAEQTHGNITLTLAGVSIGDGRARLAIPGMRGTGITVERISAGDLNLRVQIERGAGRIQQLSGTSDDLDLRGVGTVRLLRPLRMSGIDVMLRLEVKQAYRERNDRTRAIFAMLDLSPEVRPYRTPDGALQLRIAGSIGSTLRAQAAGSAAMPAE